MSDDDRAAGSARPEPYTAAALAADPAAHSNAGVPHAIDPAGIGEGDVLVLRALGLGDALTGIAPLRGLRRLFPDHRLILAAPGPVGAWLTELGVVDGVLPTPGLIDLPPLAGGHVAVDLHGRGPASQRLLAARGAEDGGPSRLIAFSCPEVGHDGPAWRAYEHEVERWCRLVADAGGPCGPADLLLRYHRPAPADAPVVLHPGAAFASRRWPVDRWRAVAEHLTGRGRRVLVTGSASERDLTAAVSDGLPGVRDLGGALDLSGLTAAVDGAALVISGDTGTGHLATALAVPSVLLFGPTPPSRWGPVVDPHLHTVLWHGDPDAAAWGDPHGETLDERLAALTVPEVIAAAAAHLPEPAPPTGSPVHRAEPAPVPAPEGSS
ncbi:glycosyltransferase family 9 protein [Tersicoccus sp. MR15.9]|uniref:glycosyltransferase family 9 protein n=1 Tax=Tersicoccus mangrovi TaxID=3121635 RepID=UPI002FE60BF9